MSECERFDVIVNYNSSALQSSLALPVLHTWRRQWARQNVRRKCSRERARLNQLAFADRQEWKSTQNKEEIVLCQSSECLRSESHLASSIGFSFFRNSFNTIFTVFISSSFVFVVFIRKGVSVWNVFCRSALSSNKFHRFSFWHFTTALDFLSWFFGNARKMRRVNEWRTTIIVINALGPAFWFSNAFNLPLFDWTFCRRDNWRAFVLLQF